jgi:hypothetical protein
MEAEEMHTELYNKYGNIIYNNTGIVKDAIVRDLMLYHIFSMLAECINTGNLERKVFWDQVKVLTLEYNNA